MIPPSPLRIAWFGVREVTLAETTLTRPWFFLVFFCFLFPPLSAIYRRPPYPSNCRLYVYVVQPRSNLARKPRTSFSYAFSAAARVMTSGKVSVQLQSKSHCMCTFRRKLRTISGSRDKAWTNERATMDGIPGLRTFHAAPPVTAIRHIYKTKPTKPLVIYNENLCFPPPVFKRVVLIKVSLHVSRNRYMWS